MNRFDGRVALVTGAGSGIGAATALRLAAEGAQVVAAGRTMTKLAAVEASPDAQGRVHPVALDVTDVDGVQREVEQVVAQHGRLDVLVNAAAINHYGTLLQTSRAEWGSVFNVIVDGAFNTISAALPHLITHRGAIINVGSISARGADRAHAAYAAAKGAIVQLTNALALDYGSVVRTNAVHPGFTLGTEMTAAASDFPHITAAFSKVIPAGRPAESEEIAAAIVFLASAEAAYVNGAHLAVDGGLSASSAQPDFSEVVGQV